jgi:hypothetical protein
MTLLDGAVSIDAALLRAIAELLRHAWLMTVMEAASLPGGIWRV